MPQGKIIGFHNLLHNVYFFNSSDLLKLMCLLRLNNIFCERDGTKNIYCWKKQQQLYQDFFFDCSKTHETDPSCLLAEAIVIYRQQQQTRPFHSWTDGQTDKQTPLTPSIRPIREKTSRQKASSISHTYCREKGQKAKSDIRQIDGFTQTLTQPHCIGRKKHNHQYFYDTRNVMTCN